VPCVAWLPTGFPSGQAAHAGRRGQGFNPDRPRTTDYQTRTGPGQICSPGRAPNPDGTRTDLQHGQNPNPDGTRTDLQHRQNPDPDGTRTETRMHARRRTAKKYPGR